MTVMVPVIIGLLPAKRFPRRTTRPAKSRWVMYTACMNLFKPTTFTWEQLGLLKWGVLLIGIAIGAEWPGAFSPYLLAIVIVGLILCTPPALAWIKEH